MAHSEKPAPQKRRKPAAPAPPAAADAVDEARRQKIADIKKALDNGTYRVSNEDIARKVIEHMFEPEK